MSVCAVVYMSFPQVQAIRFIVLTTSISDDPSFLLPFRIQPSEYKYTQPFSGCGGLCTTAPPSATPVRLPPHSLPQTFKCIQKSVYSTSALFPHPSLGDGSI